MTNPEIKMNDVAVEEVAAVVAEPSEVDFGMIGLVLLGVCAVGALGYQAYKFVKAKNAEKKARELANEAELKVIDSEDVDTDE